MASHALVHELNRVSVVFQLKCRLGEMRWICRILAGGVGSMEILLKKVYVWMEQKRGERSARRSFGL